MNKNADFKTGSVWYSKLESELFLTELYNKLNDFPDNEKTKVVASWLANSFADLTHTESKPSDTAVSQFAVHVKLLNKLVNNSSHEVADDLSGNFNEFLESFVKPSLTEAAESDTSIAEATYYFQIICDHISQPLLIRRIIKFTINYLLPVLIPRLKSESSEILISTLGLFKSLLEFYCEDLWHELLLQYLLPMKHFMVSERQKAIPGINFQDSTSKFLDLVPTSMHDTVGPEFLTEHFILYIQQELHRIQDIDFTLSRGIPLPMSEVTGIPLIEVVEASDDDESDGDVEVTRNPIFPMWVFKYDGTDVLYASRKYNASEPEEYFEDDLFLYHKDEKNNNSTGENFSFKLPTPEDSNPVRIYAESVTFPQTTTSTSANSDIRVRAVDDQGYLGPFLDALYQILHRWTRLEPDVTVMLSDVFSVLAASRIPLVRSMLLDMSIILQPIFPSFPGIINGIKAKLDGSMQKYPKGYVQQIWQKAATGSSTLLVEDNVKQNMQGGDLAESIRDKIRSSAPFSFVTQLAKGPSAATLTRLFGKRGSASPLADKRILNGIALWFETEEQEITAKKTVMRSIIFTHWMLELAAISQQSCWSQSRRNQRDND